MWWPDVRTATNLLLFTATLTLVACGFHLRGHGGPVQLAFKSVYLKTANETPFVIDLRNGLLANKVEVSETSETATVTLEIVAESSDKQILSLSTAGKVLEYQLRYRVELRAYDKQLRTWMPKQEILLMRTLTYDDAQLLAKQQEEALLFKDLRTDAVQQTLRRLSRAKPVQEEDAPAK